MPPVSVLPNEFGVRFDPRVTPPDEGLLDDRPNRPALEAEPDAVRATDGTDGLSSPTVKTAVLAVSEKSFHSKPQKATSLYINSSLSY